MARDKKEIREAYNKFISTPQPQYLGVEFEAGVAYADAHPYWNDFKKEKPTENGCYLVYDTYAISTAIWKKNHFETYSRYEDGYVKLDGVTHWREELPKPDAEENGRK